MVLNVFQCVDCQCTVFPERYFCPRCGGPQWREIDSGVGVIDQLTKLFRRRGEPEAEPILLATVRTEHEAWVVARLDEAMAQGERVRLHLADDGKVVAVRSDSQRFTAGRSDMAAEVDAGRCG